MNINDMEILIYNGHPYHYHVFGFILDFCNKYKIKATIINRIEDNDCLEWIKVYKQKYNFNCISELPSDNDINNYLFVLLLTHDDKYYPERLINNNLVCLDHMNMIVRPEIKYHIPISKFNDTIKDYTLPIFEYIDYSTKILALNNNKRPIITILGNATYPFPTYGYFSNDANAYYTKISNIDEFDIYIINNTIDPNQTNLHKPNIYLFENITAVKIIELLSLSTYLYIYPNGTPNSRNHMENKSIFSSTFLSFSIGCKLIMPAETNKYLKLTSVIEYSENTIKLDTNPSLQDTFNERDKLLKIRDNCIFNLEHMKLYNEYIK